MELKTKSQMIIRIAELSEENSSLREEVADLEDLAVKKTEYIYEEKAKNEVLQQCYQEEHCDLLKFKQALKKIKDIALKSMENNRYNGNSEYKMILGIINEVL